MIFNPDNERKFCPIFPERVYESTQQMYQSGMIVNVPAPPTRVENFCRGKGCAMWRETQDPNLGYCGLAGMPLNLKRLFQDD